ncbi:MAG: UvrD-helicase domain-containing protein, partial [Actinobacteria bacterium]|nr:UvrD-helicase domain-containing protein [Actinomycetota bacterium]
MHYIADLHIHSYYSRATSKKLNLEHLNLWAQLKGLQVVATGDITHPKWLQEMEEKLEPAQQGLFKLKDEFARDLQKEVPGACNAKVYFILSGEISSIYKKNDRVRKVHNVVFMPSFEAVVKLQATLDRIGNIHSDGRPILGLDSRNLLEIVLETDPRGQFIPAHIWTPWFSMFGSKSGFDTVEECFDDLTPHIFAVETGLSSDPPMNWRLSMLDKYALVSNSDAHSPAKLAREANVFDADLSYDALFSSLKDKQSNSFWGTIEFFPEEGKYHMDGHRACKRMMKPGETMQHKGLCPVCGKPATLGVSYRVEELADRPEGGKPDDAKPFMSLIPLPEVISEVVSVGPASKKVQNIYNTMLHKLGSELYILMDAPLKDIEENSGSLVAEAIRRMRKGHVHPQPGYDGEYGVIRIFKNDEREKILQQGTLFAVSETVRIVKDETGEADKSSPNVLSEPSAKVAAIKEETHEYGLNAEQRQAVDFHGAPLIVQAGPGTGKTRTLTHRLAALVKSGRVKPEEILAVTFTNKAAGEMRVRLDELLSAGESSRMRIQTFHAFGAEFLREQNSFYGRRRDFSIINPLQDTSF